MMEIKFRRFCRVRKQMLDVVDTPAWKLNDDSDFIYMQYTGLKDKAGREIYEGDIVSLHKGWEYTWKIEYINFALAARNIQSDNVVQTLKKVSEWKSIEVVGNIYENPELLK